MKKVKNLYRTKEGDWYIFLPESKGDKRKTLIEIKKDESKIFSFNEQELNEKELLPIKWATKELNDLRGFFSKIFILFKLNKEEIKQYKKLILINSL